MEELFLEKSIKETQGSEKWRHLQDESKREVQQHLQQKAQPGHSQYRGLQEQRARVGVGAEEMMCLRDSNKSSVSWRQEVQMHHFIGKTKHIYCLYLRNFTG